MSNTNLEVPINAVSFGSVSIAILRELYSRGLYPNVFPIGPVDLSTQKPDPAFQQWLTNCINGAQSKHNRKDKVFRLWHLVNSLQSYSNHGNDLLTFFELDSITPTESHILRQQRKVYVTSRSTQSTFSQYGIQSEYLPIGFDSYNFTPLPKRPKIEGELSFLLCGKLEFRKGHLQVLKAWAKKYGNRKEYKLNCAVHNMHMKPEDQNTLIGRALEGKQYWNINWLPWAGTNAEYNAVLQSSDIVIGMSRGEGRDLPVYHATALGAWPIALRAHAYLDYLTDDNAILVNPNGKEPAVDGIFFNQGGPFNSGSWFTWSDDDFIAACEVAERRVREQGINTKGFELQKLTYKDTVDQILKELA